jgi:hypothetical protein
MAADSGAQEIHDLLNQEAPELAENFAEIARASKNASNNPFGVMSPSGIEAVAEVRQYYRNLRVRIAGIDTVDAASKNGALASLDSVDTALDLYEQGLELGLSPEALPKVRGGERKARKAKQKINAVMGRLS